MNKSETIFCDRFSSHRFVRTIGNGPFKTAFVLNAVLNVPFIVTATLANALVVISIWRTHSLRTPANLLLIGLALSDLGVGLIVQPLYVTFLISSTKYGEVQVTCFISVAFTLAASFACCISFGTVTAISVERFISLYLHLRYQAIVTYERVRRFLLGLWLLGAILPFVWVWFAPSYRSHFFVTGIFICLLTCSVAYFKVYFVVRGHMKRIQIHAVRSDSENMARHSRSTYSMFLVYLLLLFCYLPYSISLAYSKVVGYSTCNWIVLNFGLTIVNINSSINPLIYCYRMREIRRAILVTLYVLVLRKVQN